MWRGLEFLAQAVQLRRERPFLEVFTQTEMSRREIKQFYNAVDSIFLGSPLDRIEEDTREFCPLLVERLLLSCKRIFG